MMTYHNPDYLMYDYYAEREMMREEEQPIVPDDSELQLLNLGTVSRDILRMLKRSHPHR